MGGLSYRADGLVPWRRVGTSRKRGTGTSCTRWTTESYGSPSRMPPSERAAHTAAAEVLAKGVPASLYGAELYEKLGIDAAGEPVPDLLIDALPHPAYDPKAYHLAPVAVTHPLRGGDTITAGGRTLTVLHLPGHTSVCNSLPTSPTSTCPWSTRATAAASAPTGWASWRRGACTEPRHMRSAGSAPHEPVQHPSQPACFVSLNGGGTTCPPRALGGTRAAAGRGRGGGAGDGVRRTPSSAVVARDRQRAREEIVDDVGRAVPAS